MGGLRSWKQSMLLAECQDGERLQERLQAPKFTIVSPLSCPPLQDFPALHDKYVHWVKTAFKTVPSNVLDTFLP